jgi:hypothetical protein
MAKVEMYKSKSAMKMHESGESKTMRAQEKKMGIVDKVAKKSAAGSAKSKVGPAKAKKVSVVRKKGM